MSAAGKLIDWVDNILSSVHLDDYRAEARALIDDALDEACHEGVVAGFRSGQRAADR